MSAILARLGPLATTGIGSLPFADPEPAARHATRAYTLPFCPQLPRLDGDMIAEWLGDDRRPCGWTPERDRVRPVAWDAFVAALTAHPPAHRVVKLQVTGPVTLAMAIQRTDDHAAFVALARDVAMYLAANAAVQIRELDALGLDALVVIDEPGLAAAGLVAGDAALWDPLRIVSPVWGMHVCGPVPWALIATLDIDVLSFDATPPRTAVDAAALAVLRALVRRGGHIAWGVLDPVGPASAAHAARLVEARIAALACRRLPRTLIEGHSLVTPTCGTGLLSAARERLVAATLGAAIAGRPVGSAPRP
jgi:hypothetical protein